MIKTLFNYTLSTFALIFVTALFLADAQVKQKSVTFRVMTYNIRTSSAPDTVNSWVRRRDKMISFIRYHAPDLLGIQEGMPDQVHDLAAGLPDFGWYGLGRNNGRDSGEYCAIFYRKSHFKLLNSGTFFLSEHPDHPGEKGWDAAYPRLCTWAKFRDLQNGRIFYHFNTHLDNSGKTARQKGIELILIRMKEMVKNEPVILTGDFNSTPSAPPYHIVSSNGFTDAMLKSQTPNYGPKGTNSGFDISKPLKNKIDYIFVNKPIMVLQHAILTDQQDGFYYSDHLAVIATLAFNK